MMGQESCHQHKMAKKKKHSQRLLREEMSHKLLYITLYHHIANGLARGKKASRGGGGVQSISKATTG